MSCSLLKELMFGFARLVYSKSDVLRVRGGGRVYMII